MTRILTILYLLAVPFAVAAFVYGTDWGFVVTVSAFALMCWAHGAVLVWRMGR